MMTLRLSQRSDSSELGSSIVFMKDKPLRNVSIVLSSAWVASACLEGMRDEGKFVLAVGEAAGAELKKTIPMVWERCMGIEVHSWHLFGSIQKYVIGLRIPHDIGMVGCRAIFSSTFLGGPSWLSYSVMPWLKRFWAVCMVVDILSSAQIVEYRIC